MPDHDAFHRAILAEPAADVHRLVYADWLDETGGPADAVRAEFIRVQCEADALPAFDRRRRALDQRATELFLQNWQTWWRPICLALDLPAPRAEDRSLLGRVRRGVLGGKPAGWPYYPTEAVGTYTVRRHYDPAVPWPLRPFVSAGFARGFVDALDLSGESVATGPTLTDWLGVVPAQSLRLTTRTASDFSPDDTPALRNVRTLQLEVTDANNVATYLWSPNLTALDGLSLVSPEEGVSAAEIAAVASSPAAPRLRRLWLSCGDESATTGFAAETRFTALRELSIFAFIRNGMFAVQAGPTERCVTQLAASPMLSNLESFNLCTLDVLSSVAFRALCRRPWPRLTTLDVADPLTPAHVAEMVEADAFPNLRVLSVSFVPEQANESLARLVRWPRLKQLTYFGGLSLERADPKLRAAFAEAFDPAATVTLDAGDPDPAVRKDREAFTRDYLLRRG
jgi:uncharacterized protein (TIGR02996 family)